MVHIRRASVRRLSGVAILVLLFGVVFGPVLALDVRGAVYVVEYDSTIAGMIDQVDQNTLHTYVGNLSGEWPVSIGGQDYTIVTRHTRSGTPVEKATQHVYEYLQGLELDEVSYHNWTARGMTNRNVIGVQTGTTRSEEVVLITAHLDSRPHGDLAPGADDNASGSAAVMVLADILSQYDFERTLRYVFFTGEEQNITGSQEYAEMVSAAGENIVAVYNMDMLAWDGIDGPTMRLHTRDPQDAGYAGDVEIANVFVDVVATYSMNLTPIVTSYGMTLSDHSRFWNEGYSAILVIEDDGDLHSEGDMTPYYHTTDDTLATLNMPYFTNMVEASVGTAAYLAYLDDGTPSTGVMHINDITLSAQYTKGGKYQAWATVTVVDNGHTPVESAIVYGSFSGATSDNVAGATAINGQVRLNSSVKKNGGTWIFCVDDVLKSGWIYDAAANVETCDSITVP